MTREIRKEFLVFLITILSIALHARIEYAFDLPKNALLLSIPLISAGFIMLWRKEKAREYIEKDVDWWTLIFFMLLFAMVGTLKYTGIIDIFSETIARLANGSQFITISFILWSATIGSSILDNVVLVAAYIPVIEKLKATGIEGNILWWALLFGGCLGGNITMVGSTANIIALGMLEKSGKPGISFFQWLKVGLVIGLVTTMVTWIFLIAFGSFFT